MVEKARDETYQVETEFYQAQFIKENIDLKSRVIYLYHKCTEVMLCHKEQSDALYQTFQTRLNSYFHEYTLR
jgi:hypothetical protein